MKTFKIPVRSSRKGVTFNWKQFFTPKMAWEIIREANSILKSI